jgi:hypothetical protein
MCESKVEEYDDLIQARSDLLDEKRKIEAKLIALDEKFRKFTQENPKAVDVWHE